MTILLALVLAPLTGLTLAFTIEVLAGLRPLGDSTVVADTTSCGAVIIVPAHNEAAILREKLLILLSAASDRARILIVADNCSDSTPDIAREIGLEVIERADPRRRGKGFALDFAKRHLASAPPAVVLIIDADCSTDAASIERLIAHCTTTGSPCQATNLQRCNATASLSVQLSTFAFYIKNVVRQRALQRIAGRAHLLGTGMAFPWPIFARADLATANIVEDIKLGQELANAGHAPRFVEKAAVWSNAETEKNTLSQRRRWEGGFLENALRNGPSFFVRSLARGDLRGAWAAIDLMIPPFALLILLDLAALVAGSLIAALLRARIWPLLLLSSVLLAAALALALAWSAGGRRFVTLGGLARAPFYVLWKLPMYCGFARRGAPKEWTRTERERTSDATTADSSHGRPDSSEILGRASDERF